MNHSPSIVVAASPCDAQSQREATSPTPGRALTRALDTAPALIAPSASARGPRVIPHGGAAQHVNRRAVHERFRCWPIAIINPGAGFHWSGLRAGVYQKGGVK